MIRERAVGMSVVNFKAGYEFQSHRKNDLVSQIFQISLSNQHCEVYHNLRHHASKIQSSPPSCKQNSIISTIMQAKFNHLHHHASKIRSSPPSCKQNSISIATIIKVSLLGYVMYFQLVLYASVEK